MTINELIEKRANLWKAMDAFLKAQTNEKGVLSAEDDAKYAAMEETLTTSPRKSSVLKSATPSRRNSTCR